MFFKDQHQQIGIALDKIQMHLSKIIASSADNTEAASHAVRQQNRTGHSALLFRHMMSGKEAQLFFSRSGRGETTCNQRSSGLPFCAHEAGTMLNIMPGRISAPQRFAQAAHLPSRYSWWHTLNDDRHHPKLLRIEVLQ